MATIFSRIITGEIPSYKVAENDQFYAFLDINPLAKGHTLVVPKCEVDYIFDLEDNELAAMHVFAKSVALAIQKVFPCKERRKLVTIWDSALLCEWTLNRRRNTIRKCTA